MTTRALVTHRRTNSDLCRLRRLQRPLQAAADAILLQDSSLVKMKDEVMTLRFVPSPLCQTITTNLLMKWMVNILMPTGNDYTL